MDTRLSQGKRFSSAHPSAANFFRPNWTYQRLAAGDRMIAEGRGMSPAFLSLLRLVDPAHPVSFDELGRRLPRLHADDLELWLAELCRMGLIAPAAYAGEPAAPAPDWVQDQVAANAPSVAAIAHELAPAIAAEASAMRFDTPPVDGQGFAAAQMAAMSLDFTVVQPQAPAVIEASAISLDFTVVSSPAPAVTIDAPVRPAAPAPSAASIDWKRVSMESLYEELLALCAELQAREQQPFGMLAA